MKKKKKKLEIKNSYFLVGPLALVAFFLVDVIGGFNFPGYDWITQVRGDLTALDSFSFVYGIIFAAIYMILTCFTIYCLYRYFKGRSMHKKLIFGLKLFMIASIVIAVGSTIFMQPEVGKFDKVKEYAVIGTTTEIVDSDSDMAETKDVFSMDATMDNLAKLGETIADPLTIGHLVSVVFGVLASIVAFVSIVIGGFKRSNNLVFCAAAVFCLVLVLYSCVSTLFMDATTFGINTRFAAYSITLFTCFLSSYVYVTNIEE